jgi:hypothetical protein
MTNMAFFERPEIYPSLSMVNMLAELIPLGVTAVSVGFVHCVCGPDHYVPFVAMSRVGLWSLRKTLLITLVCGVGHVAGSSVIAFIGIALGLILSQLEAFEGIRGDIAAWLLFGFGVVYLLWGLTYAFRAGAARVESGDTNQEPADESPNKNPASGRENSYTAPPQPKPAGLVGKPGQLTPWVLFTIFLFGPCEPLIPMLMVPAANANLLGVLWITLLFGLTTLLTMTTLVAMIYLGVFSMRLPRLQQWGHALAGSVVMACGASILFLGL